MHEGGSPGAALPQGALGAPQRQVAPPVAHAAPVVRGEDDGGVVILPAGLEGVHHLPNGLVHCGQHGQHQQPLLAHAWSLDQLQVLSRHLEEVRKVPGRWCYLHGGVEGLEGQVKEEGASLLLLLPPVFLNDPHGLLGIEVGAVPDQGGAGAGL